MKKRILVIALLAGSTSTAFSQDIELGVKAGLNLAKEADVEDSRMRTGFHVGVSAEKMLGDFFGVQAELLYSQMGMKYGEGNDETLTDKIDYLVLPVLAKFYATKGLSIDLGPQFGYMLSAGDSDGDSFYDMDALNKFDLSLVGGLSYRIFSRFDVSARYQFGLTKLWSDGRDRVQNRVVSIGVGYRF